MRSYKNAVGSGTAQGVSAGEGIVGSVNYVTSGNDKGINITLGIGLGLLPVSATAYATELELGKPVTDFTRVSGALESVREHLGVLKDDISNKISQKVEAVGLLSRKIDNLRNEIENSNSISPDRLNLIIDFSSLVQERIEVNKELKALNQNLEFLIGLDNNAIETEKKIRE